MSIKRGTINIPKVTGNVVITAMAKKIDSGESGGTSTISCTNISLNPIQFTFTSTGETKRIIATLTPSNTTDTLSWISSNNSIATVDQSGNVTSKSKGSCTITATCGTQSAICSVVVNIESSEGGEGGGNGTITISPKTTIITTLGDSAVLNATLSEDLQGDISWTSSNPDIISITSYQTSSVLVWAFQEGTATITATCNGVSDTCTVTADFSENSEGDGVPEPGVGIICDNPEVTYDNTTYRANLKDPSTGYTETMYVSFARNEYIEDYVFGKDVETRDSDGYPYYFPLSLSQGDSKFTINGYHPREGYISYEGGYDSNGYALHFDAKCYTRQTFHMPHEVIDLPTELVQSAMDRINNNAKGNAIRYEITTSDSAQYRIEKVEVSDEWMGMNYYTTGKIKINSTRCVEYYGEYTTSDVKIFRRWRNIIIHELGHCLGFDDQADHPPTIYNYYRGVPTDEAINNLQANDWLFLETELKRYLNYDLVNATDSTLPALPSGSYDREVTEDGGMKFTFPSYKDEDLLDKSDIAFKGSLEYIETKDLNISINPDKEVFMKYDIFEVKASEVIKGNIENMQIKIPVHQIEIDENAVYEVYLKQYDNCPCSLLNFKQGIKKL